MLGAGRTAMTSYAGRFVGKVAVVTGAAKGGVNAITASLAME